MNQWETHGEKKKQALTLRQKAWEWQRTSLSVTFSWLTPSKGFVNSSGPELLGNTAQTQRPQSFRLMNASKVTLKKMEVMHPLWLHEKSSLVTLSWVSHS